MNVLGVHGAGHKQNSGYSPWELKTEFHLYPVHSRCSWLISVLPGLRVEDEIQPSVCLFQKQLKRVVCRGQDGGPGGQTTFFV